MECEHVKGVEVDLCPDCSGVWLDGGELKNLTNFDITAGRIMSCLRCDSPMQTRMVKGVELDICPDCSSIWLDGGELKQLTDLDYTAGRVIDCPKCGKRLQTKILRGVEIDVCPGCSGVFLDKGEMEKLSAITPKKRGTTDIGQFMHDAFNLRKDLAVRTYRQGRIDKGRAAEITRMSLEEFDRLLDQRK
ncbi:MAG: zf-TFIIB domain-containing protein [Gemmatimonadota bacterium]|nr:MAG: zf-TFIIB domain-containing protein [Gemmatimonadota bacterium]